MSRDAFLNRDAKKGTASHRRAPKMEKELAKSVRGRLTAGSGNKMEKGDVRVPRFLRIEAKTTKHASFSVTIDMFRKIEDAALLTGEIPCIVVEFNNGRGEPIAELAVVPTYAIPNLEK